MLRIKKNDDVYEVTVTQYYVNHPAKDPDTLVDTVVDDIREKLSELATYASKYDEAVHNKKGDVSFKKFAVCLADRLSRSVVATAENDGEEVAP